MWIGSFVSCVWVARVLFTSYSDGTIVVVITCLLNDHSCISMQVDLSQYVESAEIILLQKNQSVTIPSLCSYLEVTPNTCKLYVLMNLDYWNRVLHELAKKHKDSVNVVFCVTGLKKGVYSVSLCKEEVLDRIDMSLQVMCRNQEWIQLNHLNSLLCACSKQYSISFRRSNKMNHPFHCRFVTQYWMDLQKQVMNKINS